MNDGLWLVLIKIFFSCVAIESEIVSQHKCKTFPPSSLSEMLNSLDLFAHAVCIPLRYVWLH